MYARKTLLIMVTLLISNFFGYLSWYFVTNNLPNVYVGSVGFAISFLGIAGIVTDLGLSSAHIKRVSEGKDLAKCIGTYAVIRLSLLILFIVIAFIAIMGYNRLDQDDDLDQRLLMIMIIWSVLSNITAIVTNTFIGKQQIAKAQIVVLVSAIIQALITIVVVTSTNDLYLYALTYVAGGIVSLATAAVLFRNFKIGRPSVELAKSYFKYALPLMFVVSATPLVLYLDKVMIDFFLDEVGVSLYLNAQKFSGLPESLAGSVMTVLFPAFSSLVAAGSIGEIRKSTWKAERFLSMALIPAALILISVSEPFIIIFSDISYMDSAPVFSILMGWVIFRGLSKPYATHFGGFNKPVYSLYLSIVYIPLNIILNLLFIPESIFGIGLLGMGIQGAALASLISAIVYYFMIRFLSYRLVRMGVNTRVIRHIVAGGIVSCVLYLFRFNIYEFTRFYELIAAFALGMLAYTGILFLFGEFGRKEIDFALDTLNPRKGVGYVMDEARR
ncbi:MAG: oligosaccharide flippase family protein [Thermoplasmatota archaeon]